MKKYYGLVVLSLFFLACSENSDSPTKVEKNTASDTVIVIPIDYSQGRQMNKRLGKGMNLGNSWDAPGYNLDNSWHNPIDDSDFEILSKAGFNSVRIPVCWNYDSDYESHKVNPERLEGVREDIQLAINQGLAVIINFHHYDALNNLGGGYFRGKEDSTALYFAEKEHFLSLWDQISKEYNSFPDSLLVFEILNEPTIPGAEIVNDLMLSAYEIIRKNAPGKTIMFEAFHASKFADLESLNLPADGNIIYSGHYYEPYSFSHEGHGYDCIGDAGYSNTAASDIRNYVLLAQKLYPDINGGHVPMNMGEFGVSGGTGTQSSCGKNGSLTSDSKKALWAKKSVQAAESYDLSWHYWGFTKVGGFESYNRDNNQWNPGFPKAFFND